VLRAWDDAPAIILSCPGPLRRHHAAVQPVSQLALPQCLLGGEAQLQAFAAGQTDLRARMFFAPMPELFSGPDSLRALMAAIGLRGEGHATAARAARPSGSPASGDRIVHLRFGGTRSARVLKDARNGLVLAENHTNPPITASQHPFADGLTLPAQFRRLFTYDRGVARPATIEGTAVPVTRLPPNSFLADLTPGGRAKSVSRAHDIAAPDGLEVISLAEFRSALWAAGPVRARSPNLAASVAAAASDGAPFVILPWNLDHPGSAVPALVERTLRLQSPGAPTVRLLVLPFNYPGQTGLIRRLIRLVRETADAGEHALPDVFIGRLTHLRALPSLVALAPVAWVDGNDPEATWSAQRLSGCGIKPILLAADGGAPLPGIAAVAADDALTISAETRFGLLHFRAQLPSLRALRQVVPLTRAMAAQPPGRRRSATAVLEAP
jgi:hypothetical protein